MKLEIKYIAVEGEYKALVLNMGQTENRLVKLFEGVSLEDVSRQALLFVELNAVEATTWH